MKRICRTLIVDDESLARQRVRRLLRSAADFDIIGEASNGPTALQAIQNLRPDLVFLDVQMPGLNGFEMLERIGAAERPAVVFVTAFDEYALKAFEAQAVDYLLKPFGDDRLQTVLQRVRRHLESGTLSELRDQVEALLHSLQKPVASDRLLVKNNGRLIFVRHDDIDWVEAEGDYVLLHCGGERHMMRGTMATLESALQGSGFIRVHRSRLVNVDRVKELRQVSAGESVVILRSGERLTASRSALLAVRAKLGGSL